MLRYKDSGRTKYVKIGRTYDISQADAKKKALQLKAEITTGGERILHVLFGHVPSRAGRPARALKSPFTGFLYFY